MARGEAIDDEWPQMNVGVTGSIPEEYVTDAEVRLNLMRGSPSYPTANLSRRLRMSSRTGLGRCLDRCSTCCSSLGQRCCVEP